jgi:DNA repair protein RadC
MKHLAPHDRPREKLERLGPAALGDNELLAAILGSGSRDAGALALANALLARVDGLAGLTRSTVVDLQQVEGIGRARAAQVLAAVELGRRTLIRRPSERPRFTSPRQIAHHLLPQFGASPVEQFGVLMLDTRHHIMRVKIVSIGSLDQTVVHPREVFREAAVASAAAIILFHNHPSGDPAPSPDDLALTHRLVEAGAILGIDVLDHVILGDHRYFSMREAGSMVLGRMQSG